MYRKTSKQRTLFEAETFLQESGKDRLKKSWAYGFARKILPELLKFEDELSVLYSDNNGRPNWSAARLLGICILQQSRDLNDQEALDAL